MADTEPKPEEVVDAEAEGEEEPTSEEPSSQGDGQEPAALAGQLMQNPMVLAALQERLGSIAGGSSGYIQSLPKSVKRRIKALKKLQFEATKIEAEFYREVHRLECEYAAKYVPLFDKRATMVSGSYEPNDEEAEWPSDDEKDDELAVSGDDVKKVAIEDKKEENTEKEEEKEDEAKGISGFWLTIFKNVDMLSEMIQPQDEPILNLIQDVKVEFKEKDPMGFTLEFYFPSNDFFENKKLTKEYIMRSEPDEADPFSFEGPEIVKCNGCKVDWKKGKNITVKTVKKKQKHKASGTTRTISKTVQSDSFFNFFNPPSPPDDEEMDEDTEALLAADFEIGHFIRERIVPRAVLYFTGEALENDDEFEDGEEEEGGEEGEYDEDADPDYSPAKTKYTRAFQARCAELALGCVSKPSSAPNDTHLAHRRNSGSSALRRDATIQTDISSRPTTAPVSINTPDKNLTKASDTNYNTKFQRSQTFLSSNPDNRPKTVTFQNRTQNQDPKYMNPLNRPVIRERTEILLPNSLQRQLIDTPKPDTPTDSRMVRENTFFRTPNATDNKAKTNNKSTKQNNKNKDHEIGDISEGNDSLDETDNVDETSQPEQKSKANTKPKHFTLDSKTQPQIKSQNTSKSQPPDKSQAANRSQPPNKVKGKPSPIVKSKAIKIPLPEELETDDELDDTVTLRMAKQKQNVRSRYLNKPRNRGSDKSVVRSTKEMAHSILQRLTGKKNAHKAGQVPCVNRPSRKYKFSQPSKIPDPSEQSTDKTAIKTKPLQKSEHNDQNTNKTTIKSKPVEHEMNTIPGPTKSAKIRRRFTFNQPSTQPNQTNSNQNLTKDDQALMSKTNPMSNSASGQHTVSHSAGPRKGPRRSAIPHQAKPVSAPVRKLPINTDKSVPSKNDSVPKPVKQAFPDPKSSMLGQDQVIEEKCDDKKERLENTIRKSIELTNHPSAKGVRKQNEQERLEHTVNTSNKLTNQSSAKGVRAPNEHDKSEHTVKTSNKITNPHVSQSGKGVRMQNALISTSLIESDKRNSPGDNISEASGGYMELVHIHPKLRESPYLKDNPLLQSGKLRRKPSANQKQQHAQDGIEEQDQ